MSHFYCTYCSASKDPDNGSIPAFKRYISSRIVWVFEKAKEDGVQFCILSGKFGLVDWNQPLPYYDYLLENEAVDELAIRVEHQIIAKKISEISYFTRSSKTDPYNVPYLKTIEQACEKAKIVPHIFTIGDPKIPTEMRDWKQIMEDAANARLLMLKDRRSGELKFAQIMTLFPDDGMVYFERGRGFEELGEFNKAINDYEIAHNYFPLDRWKWEAQEAIKRVNETLNSKRGTLLEAKQRVLNLKKINPILINQFIYALGQIEIDPSTSAISLRKQIEYITSELLDLHTSRYPTELVENIEQLRNKRIIPDIVFSHLSNIRVIGNKAAHVLHPDEDPLQISDVYSCINSFVAILEWLDKRKSN